MRYFDLYYMLFLCIFVQFSRLEQLVPEKRKEVAEFRKAHNDTKIGEVNVGMVSIQNVRLFKYVYLYSSK